MKIEQLSIAATALLLNNGAIYPFGDVSWRGILRKGARTGQLAHAGACIAAVIDLLTLLDTGQFRNNVFLRDTE